MGAERVAEKKEKRTLTSKTWATNQPNSLIGEFHCGHIHYDNKLGLGDGVRGLREIDHTLKWDETRRGWYFEYHSFHPFLPEFADGWMEFRDLFQNKDQTIKSRAVGAAHVTGQLLPKLDNASIHNCILYENALGDGVDLVLGFTRTCLKRLIRFRQPNTFVTDAVVTDAVFDFEFIFPDQVDVYRGRRSQDLPEVNGAYKLDMNRNKIFDTDKKILIGQHKDGEEAMTYINIFYCWDDERKQRINVEYRNELGQKTLRKIIPLDFLKTAQGMVYSDDTTTIYAGSADGIVVGTEGSVWATMHDAASGGSTDTLDLVPGGYISGGNYNLRRAYTPFDTSSLGSGATVTAVDASLHATTINDSDNDGNDWINVVQATIADAASLTTADYDQIGAVSNPTEGATRKDITTDFTAETYATWTLDATGRSWIVVTGTTQLGWREGHDALNSAYDVATETRVRFKHSETAGTSTDPKLDITYTPGAAVAKKMFATLGVGK